MNRAVAPRNPGKTLLRAIAIVLACLLLLPYGLTPLYWIVRPVSTPMLWRWVRGERVERIWAPLETMSPALPLAVLIAEDARFCQHAGVDWQGVQAAIEDAEDGEIRGASGIPQQVAKNLFLWPGRSYVRTALEVPLAYWIDFVLGKRRTLEIYLNIAEWGPNGEFGAEAGARRAFNRSARELTLHEAALLAAILPNPIRRSAARPRPILLRLAALYQARALRSLQVDQCVRGRRGR
jgi:monofunctional biosynthetic peptidoglycan transglycosylase